MESKYAFNDAKTGFIEHKSGDVIGVNNDNYNLYDIVPGSGRAKHNWRYIPGGFVSASNYTLDADKAVKEDIDAGKIETKTTSINVIPSRKKLQNEGKNIKGANKYNAIQVYSDIRGKNVLSDVNFRNYKSHAKPDHLVKPLNKRMKLSSFQDENVSLQMTKKLNIASTFTTASDLGFEQAHDLSLSSLREISPKWKTPTIWDIGKGYSYQQKNTMKTKPVSKRTKMDNLLSLQEKSFDKYDMDHNVGNKIVSNGIPFTMLPYPKGVKGLQKFDINEMNSDMIKSKKLSPNEKLLIMQSRALKDNDYFNVVGTDIDSQGLPLTMLPYPQGIENFQKYDINDSYELIKPKDKLSKLRSMEDDIERSNYNFINVVGNDVDSVGIPVTKIPYPSGIKGMQDFDKNKSTVQSKPMSPYEKLQLLELNAIRSDMNNAELRNSIYSSTVGDGVVSQGLPMTKLKYPLGVNGVQKYDINRMSVSGKRRPRTKMDVLQRMAELSSGELGIVGNDIVWSGLSESKIPPPFGLRHVQNFDRFKDLREPKNVKLDRMMTNALINSGPNMVGFDSGMVAIPFTKLPPPRGLKGVQDFSNKNIREPKSYQLQKLEHEISMAETEPRVGKNIDSHGLPLTMLPYPLGIKGIQKFDLHRGNIFVQKELNKLDTLQTPLESPFTPMGYSNREEKGINENLQREKEIEDGRYEMITDDLINPRMTTGDMYGKYKKTPQGKMSGGKSTMGQKIDLSDESALNDVIPLSIEDDTRGNMFGRVVPLESLSKSRSKPTNEEIQTGPGYVIPKEFNQSVDKSELISLDALSNRMHEGGGGNRGNSKGFMNKEVRINQPSGSYKENTTNAPSSSKGMGETSSPIIQRYMGDLDHFAHTDKPHDMNQQAKAAQQANMNPFNTVNANKREDMSPLDSVDVNQPRGQTGIDKGMTRGVNPESIPLPESTSNIDINEPKPNTVGMQKNVPFDGNKEQDTTRWGQEDYWKQSSIEQMQSEREHVSYETRKRSIGSGDYPKYIGNYPSLINSSIPTYGFDANAPNEYYYRPTHEYIITDPMMRKASGISASTGSSNYEYGERRSSGGSGTGKDRAGVDVNYGRNKADRFSKGNNTLGVDNDMNDINTNDEFASVATIRDAQSDRARNRHEPRTSIKPPVIKQMERRRSKPEIIFDKLTAKLTRTTI